MADRDAAGSAEVVPFVSTGFAYGGASTAQCRRLPAIPHRWIMQVQHGYDKSAHLACRRAL